MRTAIGSAALALAAEAVMRLPDRLVRPTAGRLMRRGLDLPAGREFIARMLADLRTRWPGLHPRVRRRFAANFFGRLLLLSAKKHAIVRARLGDWPAVMAISPTMRCNLACEGCYSAEYDRAEAITTARFDALLTECEDLGIYLVVVSGGEPFLRGDLIDMFARHPATEFLVFTNGTLIARRGLAPALASLGNVVPCVSVEGLEGQTDARRGRGVHAEAMAAMAALREAGVLFGFSATPMRHTSDLAVSDAFVGRMARAGCFFGFYFNYVPLGRNPDLSLMPTPEQRRSRSRRVRELRRSGPVLVTDFWCDGDLAGGCLSAGRVYFHVNAAGGVEPCVFHQFSVDSILDRPLIDALDSPYFRHLRGAIATFDDWSRPCPVIDRPDVARAAITRFGARPSQPGGERLLAGPLADGLDRYAAELKTVMVRERETEREEPGGVPRARRTSPTGT
jgi:MoaA/NifB/PqqE/SkfB family radical SAM enzyme